MPQMCDYLKGLRFCSRGIVLFCFKRGSMLIDIHSNNNSYEQLMISYDTMLCA